MSVATGAGSFVESTATQLIDTGTVDLGKTVVDTAAGAALGKVPGLKVPGITSGRNSFSSVTQGQLTKLANGTAQNTSLKTVGKGVVAGVVGGSTQTATDVLLDATGSKDAASELANKAALDASKAVGTAVCETLATQCPQ